MTNVKTLLLSLACPCLVLGLSSLAAAGGPCSGYMVTNANGDQVLFYDNPSFPRHLAVGRCLGSGEKGTCTYRDREGDEWTTTYEMPTGAAGGTWKKISGAGKYATDVHFGTYREVGWVETLYVGAWTGQCE